MHSETPPVTPACRAVSISAAFSGPLPDPYIGCWANSAEWKRMKASLFSSATQ